VLDGSYTVLDITVVEVVDFSKQGKSSCDIITIVSNTKGVG